MRGLGAKYVLVGDDFRFGARRAGDYALLDAAGPAAGFDVARMMSYEVHRLRVSSSAVRQAVADGDMAQAATLLGRPYSISGHVLHGRKLGRELGTPTLNLRFGHARPAAQGIFAAILQNQSDRLRQALFAFLNGSALAVGFRYLGTVRDIPIPHPFR